MLASFLSVLGMDASFLPIRSILWQNTCCSSCLIRVCSSVCKSLALMSILSEHRTSYTKSLCRSTTHSLIALVQVLISNCVMWALVSICRPGVLITKPSIYCITETLHNYTRSRVLTCFKWQRDSKCCVYKFGHVNLYHDQQQTGLQLYHICRYK